MREKPGSTQWRKWFLLVTLAGAGLVLGLRSKLVSEAGCTLARRHLPALLGAEVGIGRCEMDPITQTVRLHGVSVFRPGADAPFFAADMAEVSVRSMEPFFGRVEIGHVRIDRPRLNLDLDSPSPGGRNAQACVLEPLRRVRIGRLDIRHGQVWLRSVRGRVEVGDLDVQWRTKNGVAHVLFETGAGVFQSPNGAELGIAKVAIEGDFNPKSESIDLSRAELDVADGNLSFSGKLDQLCDMRLAIGGQAFVPAATLDRALDLGLGAKGHLWSRIAVSGRAAEPTVALELVSTALDLDALSLGDFRGRATYQGEELRLEDFVFEAGAGVAKLVGAIRLTKGFPTTLRIDASGAQFAPLLARFGLKGSWVDFPLTGRASVAGALSPFELSGVADMTVGRFSLTSPPANEIFTFPRAKASVAVRFLADRAELSQVRIQTGASVVEGDATLFFDEARGFRLNAVSSAADLADYPHLSGLRWAGKGSAVVDIAGPYGDPRVEAAVSLRDFELWKVAFGVVQGRIVYEDRVLSFPAITAQKGKSQYHGRVQLTYGAKDIRQQGELSMPDGQVQDLIDALVPMHSTFALMRGDLRGQASARLWFDSPVDRFDGGVEVTAQDTTYRGRRLGKGKLRARFRDGTHMDVEEAAFDGELGRLHAEGTFSYDGKMDYRIRGEALTLAELLGPNTAARFGIRGLLFGSAKVGGTGDEPEVTASLTSQRLTFGDKSMGSSRLEARVTRGELTIQGEPFSDARVHSVVKLKEPYPYEASLVFALPEIRPLLPSGAVAQGVSGSVAGSVSATGRVSDERSLRASITLDRVSLGRGDFSGRNDAAVVMSYSDGRLTLEPMSFRGPNTELTAAGWIGPADVDMKVHGIMDMRLLESFAPALERSGGRVQLAASATGSIQSPAFVGSAEVYDARASLRSYPLAVRGVSGRVEFSENRVLLQGLDGALNDGRVSLRGDVLLDRFVPKHLDLRLGLDEVTVQADEALPVKSSGSLYLYGKPDALVLTGALDVEKLRYERSFDFEALFGQLKKARQSHSGQKPVEWLSMDVKVRAVGDVRVDNNVARARLMGDLVLTGTNLRPGLLGSVEAVEGSQVFYRGNEFNITHGQIEFRDRYRIDPLFDLHAEAQVREYVVRLHAFGGMADTKVTLSSEPELPEGDIVSLLTLGVTSRDRDAAGGVENAQGLLGAGLAAEALFNASGLDQQLKRFVPMSPLLRRVSFQLSTQYNDVTGRVEPTAQFESKFLSERLKLGMTKPVFGNATRAQAEYRFNNRLSAQAQWDNEHSDNAFGNLGLDLKFRWEVE